MTMRKILLLNGPNLDMLGTREPEVYGTGTLESLEEMVVLYARQRGVSAACVQSNSEAVLVERIHQAMGRYDGIVYNPGAHTHYSYALRDAVGSVDVPVVEVHISDVDAREPFRKVSVIAPACAAQVKGLGFEGYCRAIDILVDGDASGVGFGRLGEGYEARFPEGLNVRVAGEEHRGQLPAPTQTAGGAFGVAPTSAGPEATPRAAEREEDFTEPFAQEIAAASAHMAAMGRRNLVGGACAQLGIDALLVRDTSNIRWLTAIDGVFDEERAHALVVAQGGAALHTDTRYSNAIRNACERMGSDVMVNDERMGHAEFAHAVLGGQAFAGRLGIEDTVTYAEFAKLAGQFGTAALSATTDVVLSLRAVKSGPELTRMLAAQAVTDAAFLHIVRFIRPGMTEREVQLELDRYMLAHGGEALAFPSIVATGANGADPHAIPGATRLEAGQCVVMDFGAKAFGYCSDMTRTVFLGQPDAKMARAWETLRRANEAVEALLRPGVTGKEAHETAERVLAEGGFGGAMGHGLGHGVGLDVHELPVLNMRNEAPLVPGNVVTVEPGIYLPGEFGMRLEDCGVVTPNGYEVFSQLGHDMVVL